MFDTQNDNEYDHAPGANLDYGFDWSDFLTTGETIATSSWTATSGITLSNPSVTGSITATFAAGGVEGVLYTLTNTIVTNASPARTDIRTLVLSCKRK